MSKRSSPLPPTFTSTAIFDVLLIWINGWWCHIWYVLLLNDIRDLYISTLGTLVREQPWYVFMQQSLKFTDFWHIIWLFAGTLIWYHKHIYTQWHTALSADNRLTHPFKYILTSPDMCSQQLSVLQWIIHWCKKFPFQILFYFQKLLTFEVVYLLIRCNKSKFFHCQTQIILIEMV